MSLDPYFFTLASKALCVPPHVLAFFRRGDLGSARRAPEARGRASELELARLREAAGATTAGATS